MTVNAKSEFLERGSTALRPYVSIVTLLVASHVVLLYEFSQLGLAQYAGRGDGAEYLAAAEALARGKLVGYHFPLYPALIGVASLLVSKELAALAIPAVFHTFFALAVYKILDTLKFRRALLYALVLAFFPPSALIYTSSPISDSLVLFLAALVFYFGLKRKESPMLLSSFLAGATHYMGMLLVVPLGYWYWRNDRRRMPLASVPLLPFAILSLIKFASTGDLFYYVTVHFAYSSRVWSTPLVSYPFVSLVYTATVLRGLERLYWFGYVAVVFAVYGIGLAHGVKTRANWSVAFSAPFYVLMTVYAGYYFVPRFLLYAFPSLMEYPRLENRFKAILWLAIAVTIASAAYAVWFLLIRVPATGFTS
jgi:hypothetical protein